MRPFLHQNARSHLPDGEKFIQPTYSPTIRSDFGPQEDFSFPNM